MEIREINTERIAKETRIFFHSQTWKNILVFLVFVLLAFCFWMMQYFQQKMEREITVSIEYINMPEDIVLSDSIPQELTVRIVDKGTAFLKYYYNKTNLQIDLKDISPDKNTYQVKHSILNYKVLDALSNSSQLISFKPEALEINYATLEKKELSVRIDGKILPASGYIFTDSLHIEPSTVWVYATKEHLDSLSFINTVQVNKENIQKDLDLTVDLEKKRGVRLSADKVKIYTGVEEYTEKIFTLPIVCYNVPEDITVRFFPSTVEVNCRIALSMYSKLNAEDLEISVDYNEIKNNSRMTIPLELVKKPEWLISYRIVPETSEFLFEQK